MTDYDLLLSDEWDPSGATTWGDEGAAPPSCDCPTAPRQFLIPPPPPPPALGVCGGSTFGDRSTSGYFCHLEPMGAEFTQAGFPSLPVIAVCSSVVLVAVLVASFLLWRFLRSSFWTVVTDHLAGDPQHKTKVQNLLPCKHEQPGHCDHHPGTNGVTYEDVLINHHPTRLPMTTSPMVGGQTLMPIELLDVKLGDIVPSEGPTLHQGSFYPAGGRVLGSKPFHHPVYEEISREPSAVSKSVSKSYDSDVEESGRGGRSFTTTSEDDFAEDELSGLEYPSGEGSHHCSATSSVQGSTGGDLCRDPVSSDEGGAVEDSDYQSGLLPENTFDYNSGKHLNIPHRHHDGHLVRIPPNVNPGQTQFLPNVMPPPIFTTNHSRPEDCSNSAQRLLPPVRSGYGEKPPTGHHLNPGLGSNNKWAVCPPPAVATPVENIYSTIDEGEDSMDDRVSSVSPIGYPANRGPPSRSNVPKTKQPPDQRMISPVSSAKQLSQRNPDEESESYGDIMPAYGTSACT